MKLAITTLVLSLASGIAVAQFPPQIKNVVVIFQENRTPDNLFHFLAPACPLPTSSDALYACIPTQVTSGCYDISPCGLSNKGGHPVPVTLKPLALAASVDPDHSHKAFNEMCDPDPATLHCRNDGAWRDAPSNSSYSYVANTAVTNYDGSKGHLLDPYLKLATQYGWANFMYQTNQGPSYPAHQYIFSGTSSRTAEDDANATFVAENPDGEVFGNNGGCLAPASVTNALLSPALSSPAANCKVYGDNSVKECPLKNSDLIYPTNPVGSFCFAHQSMADVLDPQSISWKYYAAEAGSIWTAPDSIKAICEPAWVNPNGDPKSGLECTGKEWKANVDLNNKGTNILRDIANCNLAQVNWVTPDGAWSDHVGSLGPSWVAAIVNAIGNNHQCPAGTKDAGQTYWQNTAIIINWDDWGGWSDNQPPLYKTTLPCRSTDCYGDYETGFRVPLIVVSAYTPAGYIDNIPRDSAGSILRMIEGINNLPEGLLGFADKRSNTDLHEFFTLSAPRKYVTIPAQKSATYFLQDKTPAQAPDLD